METHTASWRKRKLQAMLMLATVAVLAVSISVLVKAGDENGSTEAPATATPQAKPSDVTSETPGENPDETPGNTPDTTPEDVQDEAPDNTSPGVITAAVFGTVGSVVLALAIGYTIRKRRRMSVARQYPVIFDDIIGSPRSTDTMDKAAMVADSVVSNKMWKLADNLDEVGAVTEMSMKLRDATGIFKNINDSTAWPDDYMSLQDATAGVVDDQMDELSESLKEAKEAIVKTAKYKTAGVKSAVDAHAKALFGMIEAGTTMERGFSADAAGAMAEVALALKGTGVSIDESRLQAVVDKSEEHRVLGRTAEPLALY